MSNDDIKELAYILKEPGTPVIISDTGLDNISAREELDINTTELEILTRMEGWKSSWEEKNINNYLSYYSEAAKYNSDNYPKWTAHKINILKKTKDLRINIKDISIFEYPGNNRELMLVKFKQVYSSNLLKNEMSKQKIWSRENSDWFIIYEGGT